MKQELATFLKHHKPLAEDSTVWGNMPLRITSHLSDELPPHDYITSVRCLVLRKRAILVVRNPDETHIIPGGRCEAGETFEETLRREVLEETGWTIVEPKLLGFMYFHHLNPKPPGYKYPHPDFLQLIYTAEADQLIPDAKQADDYEIEANFRLLDEVKALELSQGEGLYLDSVGELIKTRHTH
jgi:ADP-ribose pyrophosphatase YjhB (NUDIX family)